MLDETAIRRLARDLGVRTDYAEKEYVNSWVLYGIYMSGFGDGLLFKGGTALRSTPSVGEPARQPLR